MDKRSNIEKLFSETDCLSAKTIQRYLSDELTDREEYAVERHINACPFCADAVEGFLMLENPAEITGQVNILNNKIKNLATTNAINKQKAITFTTKKPVFYYISIAASILLIIGFYMLYHFSELPEDDVAQTIEESAKESGRIVSKDEIEQSTDYHTVEEPKPSDKKEISVIDNQDKGSGSNESAELADETTVDDDIQGIRSTTDSDNKELQPIEYDKINNQIAENKMSELAETNEKAVVRKDEPVAVLDEMEENDIMQVTDDAGNERKMLERKKQSSIIKDRSKASRDEETNISSNYKFAVQLFNDSAYQKALKLFERELENNPNSTEAMLFTGKCLSKLNHHNKAITYFDAILSMKKSVYTAEAQWQKLKSLLALGKNENALLLIEEIKSENSKNKEKVNDILDSLLNNQK